MVLELVEVQITFRHSPFKVSPIRDAHVVGGSSCSQGNSKEEVRTNFQMELKTQIKLLS